MQITIDLPDDQKDAVLDAFSDGQERSEEVVARRLKEIVALAVAQKAAQVASREAVETQKAAVAKSFGVTLPEPQRGPGGPGGRPQGR